jgi:hypothetical protein
VSRQAVRRLITWLVRRRPPVPPAPPAIPPGPPIAFSAGPLRVRVTCQGTRTALQRAPRVVYEVVIEETGSSRSWTSRYGFNPDNGSERRAAEAALAELERIHRDPRGWQREWTAGMSHREMEAFLGDPRAERDREAATWIGPALDGLGPDRGAWLVPAGEAEPASGSD